MKIAFKNSKILMINGRTLTPVPGMGPEPGLHYVYTLSEGHGSISASPMSGKKDTLITLSNTPDQNYIFSKYTLNNVDLAGSSFLMPDEDAYVRGYFQPEPTPEVTIGQQVWMSRNLAVDDGQGGIYHQTVNYGQGDVVEYYYTQQAALRVASSIPGWHLPADSEFLTLINYINSGIANKLKSTYGWNTTNGTDIYGFCGLPAGYFTTSVMNKGKIADFWTATQYQDENHAFCRELSDTGVAFLRYASTKASKYSVRLVKDS